MVSNDPLLFDQFVLQMAAMSHAQFSGMDHLADVSDRRKCLFKKAVGGITFGSITMVGTQTNRNAMAEQRADMWASVSTLAVLYGLRCGCQWYQSLKEERYLKATILDSGIDADLVEKYLRTSYAQRLTLLERIIAIKQNDCEERKAQGMVINI